MELPKEESIIRLDPILVLAKVLGPHAELERMTVQVIAINKIRVTNIEDGHLISLVHLWRFKNVEE